LSCLPSSNTTTSSSPTPASHLPPRQLTSPASRPPFPTHLPPQTCVSSTTTPPSLLSFLITAHYLIYHLLFVLLTPLTASSLYTSLTSQGTGTPHAGHGRGRRTGQLPSSNALPSKPSMTLCPSPPNCACSRSGMKITKPVTQTHHISPSHNPLTPITSTPSYRESWSPTLAAFNAPPSKLSQATPSKEITHADIAPPPLITPHAPTADASTTRRTSSTSAENTPFPGPASSLVATSPYSQPSLTNMGDVAYASSSKPPTLSSVHSPLIRKTAFEFLHLFASYCRNKIR
jgi:hypothetical protein